MPLRPLPRCCAAGLLLIGLLATGVPARAGAPFVTDDPGTPEHFEINLAVQATHVAGQTTGFAPSLEVNYAAAENVQLHVLVPLAFNHESGNRTRWGAGDTEFGVKYRFLDAEEADWFPSAAVFPIVFAPTGDEERGLGTGHTRTFLPLWLGKEFGEWTAFGGGYGINPGRGNRNYLFVGAASRARSPTICVSSPSCSAPRIPRTTARMQSDSISAASTTSATSTTS